MYGVKLNHDGCTGFDDAGGTGCMHVHISVSTSTVY